MYFFPYNRKVMEAQAERGEGNCKSLPTSVNATVARWEMERLSLSVEGWEEKHASNGIGM
jgi:hypothetical protein